ncbi:MAG TPA: DUF952 domain-containing protein [Trichormus sp. M33_DOE_039]|nr:DUF952 domain-containing protein [Trichormus sp. M33_DOE_039]
MKLVIFDVDGTLTNSNTIDADCFLKAFELEFGFSKLISNWNKYTNVTDSGITNQIFIKRLLRLPTKEELLRVKKSFVSLLKEASQEKQHLFSEIPGSAQMLAELRLNRDWCIAIATGGWYDSALLKIEKANLNIEGIPIASADDGTSREDIIDLTIFKSQIFYQTEQFQKIVFVGDGVWDVKTAYNLNINFIGLNNKLNNSLKTAGAITIINDFTDLDDFLKQLDTATIPKSQMNIILHITQIQQWEKAKIRGSYHADSLNTEGFIHCSQPTQIIKVANRFFHHQQESVILLINSAQVKPEIRYEEADGEIFPHIYGELNLDAVYQVIDFEPEEDGLFELPQAIINLE